jgi:hypothetical protein
MGTLHRGSREYAQIKIIAKPTTTQRTTKNSVIKCSFPLIPKDRNKKESRIKK